MLIIEEEQFEWSALLYLLLSIVLINTLSWLYKKDDAKKPAQNKESEAKI